MNPYIHPRLKPLLVIGQVLETAARELAAETRKRSHSRKPRARRGGTLRPSAETPLWNAVALMVKPYLRRRGDRALLARELGLHRARIGEYFDKLSAMPDAERALQLLVWLNHQRNRSKK